MLECRPAKQLRRPELQELLQRLYCRDLPAALLQLGPPPPAAGALLAEAARGLLVIVGSSSDGSGGGRGTPSSEEPEAVVFGALSTLVQLHGRLAAEQTGGRAGCVYQLLQYIAIYFAQEVGPFMTCPTKLCCRAAGLQAHRWPLLKRCWR